MSNNVFPAPAFAGCDYEIELAGDADIVQVQMLAEAGLTETEAVRWAEAKACQ